MGLYLAQIIDDEPEQAAARIMNSSRQGTARVEYDGRLYVGLGKLRYDEDEDDPGVLYGSEAEQKFPEGFNDDDETLDVDVNLAERS